MSISNIVKSALSRNGIKQNELMQLLKVTSKQALSNKMKYDRWSGKDLISVAELTGGRLAFVYPDGQTLFINAEKAPDESSPEATE